TIDHVERVRMFANRARCLVGKDCPTPGGKGTRSGGLRESIGQTKFLDLVSGIFPLRGELKPDSRCTEPRIPRKINNSKNSKRLTHSLKKPAAYRRPKFVSHWIHIMTSRN